MTRAIAALLLLLCACHPRGTAMSWREEEVGQSRKEPRVERKRGTRAEAEKKLAAAATPAELVMAAVDVAALGGDVVARRGEIRAAIDQLGEAELEEAADAAEPALEPAGAIALRMALFAHHRGDDAAARGWLERFVGAADASDAALAEVARALSAETVAADAKVIAVLLPLSGRYAAIGEELRAAIELAPRDGATLAFLDTTGTEAEAAAAVDRAAARGAVAILGPVGERESVAAARRAAELGIPIALLAPADGADPAAGVFRLVASPADEARGAARLAARESVPTAAVLAPRDDVGAAMADAFAAEATKLGITVTRVGTYDPTASDLQPDVEEFLRVRWKGRKRNRTAVPDVDFSMLYLPDRYDRAALVTAFLPYLGVELYTGEDQDPDLLARKHGGRIPQVVQLLGSSGWNHPGLITRGGDDVEGALLVDACSGLLDELGASGEVAARYQDATGVAASSPALEAYDAARIVLAARVRAAHERDDVREAMRAALARAALDDGACPPATIGADGELAREPVVLMVDGGQFVLQSF